MQNTTNGETSTRTALIFLLHQLISTIGVIVFSGVSVFGLIGLLRMLVPTAPRASWILTEMPGFPVQFLIGIGLGSVLGKSLRSRSAVWVWILPLVFLVFGLFIVSHPESSSFGHLIGTNCRPSERCFDQLLFTLPFVAALGYAAGVLLKAIQNS